MTNKIEVGIVMGSDSDWPLVKSAAETLEKFGLGYEVRVISAHRTPELAFEYASSAADRGLKVLISAAGGAAHLGGVIAAHTILPVIGIPVKGGALNGIDALLATLQMPAGIPVATVTLGSAGPVNAAILAAQMIALGNSELTQTLVEFKETLKEKVANGNARVQEDLK
ncbi:MAG: 5-(carboxyamino)imidazole ribonucleotide mutase [Kiritimatiellae bacterium]|jgi:5-(carboxyamino)imidazole ribonucleotide mutase|nr:5-(carboxyamino)imidazole ribonucleotide mutase [Kiritimatiellia bacterium]